MNNSINLPPHMKRFLLKRSFLLISPRTQFRPLILPFVIFIPSNAKSSSSSPLFMLLPTLNRRWEILPLNRFNPIPQKTLPKPPPRRHRPRIEHTRYLIKYIGWLSTLPDILRSILTKSLGPTKRSNLFSLRSVQTVMNILCASFVSSGQPHIEIKLSNIR